PAWTVRSSVTGTDDGGVAPPRKLRRSVPSVASFVDSMCNFEWYVQLELDAIGSEPLDAPAGSNAGQREQEEERYPGPPPHEVEDMRTAVEMGSSCREENDEDEKPIHSTLLSDMIPGAGLGMQVHGRPHSFEEGFYDPREPSFAPSNAHVAL
ncbi:hypothetical protein HDU96_010073, partial [Phlyctochytrium bullatum]